MEIELINKYAYLYKNNRCFNEPNAMGIDDIIKQCSNAYATVTPSTTPRTVVSLSVFQKISLKFTK